MGNVLLSGDAGTEGVETLVDVLVAAVDLIVFCLIFSWCEIQI